MNVTPAPLSASLSTTLPPIDWQQQPFNNRAIGLPHHPLLARLPETALPAGLTYQFLPKASWMDAGAVGLANATLAASVAKAGQRGQTLARFCEDLAPQIELYHRDALTALGEDLVQLRRHQSFFTEGGQLRPEFAADAPVLQNWLSQRLGQLHDSMKDRLLQRDIQEDELHDYTFYDYEQGKRLTRGHVAQPVKALRQRALREENLRISNGLRERLADPGFVGQFLTASDEGLRSKPHEWFGQLRAPELLARIERDDTGRRMGGKLVQAIAEMVPAALLAHHWGGAGINSLEAVGFGALTHSSANLVRDYGLNGGRRALNDFRFALKDLFQRELPQQVALVTTPVRLAWDGASNWACQTRNVLWRDPL